MSEGAASDQPEACADGSDAACESELESAASGAADSVSEDWAEFQSLAAKWPRAAAKDAAGEASQRRKVSYNFARRAWARQRAGAVVEEPSTGQAQSKIEAMFKCQVVKQKLKAARERYDQCNKRRVGLQRLLTIGKMQACVDKDRLRKQALAYIPEADRDLDDAGLQSAVQTLAAELEQLRNEQKQLVKEEAEMLLIQGAHELVESVKIKRKRGRPPLLVSCAVRRVEATGRTSNRLIPHARIRQQGLTADAFISLARELQAELQEKGQMSKAEQQEWARCNQICEGFSV